MKKNIDKKAKHFIKFFGNNSLEVIKKCKNRGDDKISLYNEELFDKVEKIIIITNEMV
jgi:hypothetical protein